MKRDSNNPTPPGIGPRMVAVIDIGASSLRMQLAEINMETGSIRKLESYAQAVSVGKDSFIKGFIEKSTIEDCNRIKIGCVSGSPKRQLNSITNGSPAASIMRPAYKNPV